MIVRLGSALVLMGLIALVIFAVTSANDQADPRTLLLGAGLSALGLLLRRRPAEPEEEDGGRFETLRKLIGRRPPTEED